jgi:phage-related protein
MTRAPGFEAAGEIAGAFTSALPTAGTFTQPLGKAVTWGIGGALVGGVEGALGGAALGLTVGVLQQFTEKLKLCTAIFDRLAMAAKSITERFAAFSANMAAMSREWQILERHINRVWAQALVPLMSAWNRMAMEWRERWEAVKVRIFQALEPILFRLLAVLERIMRFILPIIEAFAAALSRVIKLLGPGLTDVLIGIIGALTILVGVLTGALVIVGLVFLVKVLVAVIGALMTVLAPIILPIVAIAAALIAIIALLALLFRQPSVSRPAAGLMMTGPPLVPPPGQGIETSFPTPGRSAGNVAVTISLNDNLSTMRAFEEVWEEIRQALREREANEWLALLRLRAEGSYA